MNLSRLLSKGVKLYGRHTAWLLFDKFFKLLLGLVVTILVARYLGPDQFGILNYVFSFVAMLAPIAKLGLDGIVSRELASERGDLPAFVSTVVAMKFVGASALLLISISYMYLVEGSGTHILLAALFSSVFIFRSLEVYEFLFRVMLRGKIIAVANICAAALSAVLKLLFVASSFSLVFFAFANAIEALVAMGLLVFLGVSRSKQVFKFSQIKLDVAVGLIKESWPLILSGFFALVYLYIDQLMIESILGNNAVGQYSAASRLSSAVYFIPLTIGWALQAAVIKAREQSVNQYYQVLHKMTALLVVLAYLIVIPIIALSDWLVNLLYGGAYSESAGVLSIHMWAAVFVFVGASRGLWAICERKHRFTLASNVVGGCLNIVLNLLLLEPYGIEGAAWATLISYAVTYFLSGLMYSPVHRMLMIQLKSLTLMGVVTLSRDYSNDSKS